MKKDFKLSDLESGMVVETRNGQMWLVIDKAAYNYHDGSTEWLDFDIGYNDCGVCTEMSRFDIVAVYGKKYGHALKYYIDK